jgi:hypothetical protein
MKLSSIQKTVLAIMLSGVFQQEGVSFGSTIDVASGNSAGESERIGPLLAFKELPPSPSGLVATREDKTTVKLTWFGAVPSNVYTFAVFRSIDNSPWVCIATLSNHEYTDGTADIESDLRYVVATQKYSGLSEQVTGPPSNEERVNWSPAVLTAGASEPYIPPPPLTNGYFTITEFLPNLTGWLDGPSEFTLSSFGNVSGEGPWEMYDEQGGWIRRGVQVSARADIVTEGFYRSVSAGIGTLMAWSGLVPPATVEYESPNQHLSMPGSVFAIYDGAVIADDGNDRIGFDGKSNPVSQLVPLGENRTLRFDTFPKVANVDTEFFLHADDGLTFNPVVIAQDPVDVIVTDLDASGEREIAMVCPATRGQIIFNVHKKRTLTVGIYKLLTRSWAPGETQGRIVDKPLGELPAAILKTDLNRIFGEQANVWFEVENVLTPVYFDSNPNGTNDDTALLDAKIDFVLESQKLQDIANNDTYHLSVFLCGPSAWGETIGGKFQVMPFFGGAFGIGAKFALMSMPDSAMTAHEIGHLLGLRHAFQAGTGYSTNEIPDDWQQRIMGYDRTGQNRLLKMERDIVRVRAKLLLGEP